MSSSRILSVLFWILISILGAISYVTISFHRGEPLNAGWILAAALCTYAIGYRFYSKWIAVRLLTLNDRRATPCEAHEDGRDFVKTNKWIVFGHHFAAISGPGPLVGPVLAAQFGYLPGSLWILIGVVLGGAVQDFIILFASTRRDGKSLGEMVKEEIGSVAGIVALLAILSIMIILIAVLGFIVVKALAESPWGTFTIAATMPIAIFMGFYLRFFRPGKVLEVTVMGVLLLLLSVYGGKFVYENATWAHAFTLSAKQLAWCIIAYGLAASILPVWMLLAPRDYLSTFMKLGTIGALALGILAVMPSMQMPAVSRFVDGSGPIFAGKLFPFCFITIACGAISGFHSLIASGITPKIITRESHIRPVGYGSMLLESGVAVMAMIAACTLEPGTYFAINAPSAVVSVEKITELGFPVTMDQMNALANELGEKTMFDRGGGAPTLAVGMAKIFSQFVGGGAMGLWYHFAIMFEALFILTTVDAGTRVGRFLIQAFLGHVWKPLGDIRSYPANIFASVLLVSAWGYFMYGGVMDPLGGIKSLWPLFGIANQLLAVVALCLATTILIKMGKGRFAWVTLLPLAVLMTVTFTAGFQKIFSPDPQIGFLAQTKWLATQSSIPPGKLTKMMFNARLDAWVAGIFLILVGAIFLVSGWRWVGLILGRNPLDLRETAPVWLSEEILSVERARGGRLGFFGWMLILLALARHLSGQTQLDRAQKQATCCAKHVEKGALWADMEEKRFKSPRCC